MCWRSRWSISRFNGAAPFGARRYNRRAAECGTGRKLQRGRAFWGAEIGPGHPARMASVQRFNGAAPFGARRFVGSESAIMARTP